MTRVLLIRSLEDALPLVQTLKEKGIESAVHPLYEPRFHPLPSLENPQAFIITSKNAVRAIEGDSSLKSIPLYVVGDQTAEFAKSKGFKTIYSASGTSEELLPLILENTHRDRGILWHLSGEIIKKDISAYLQAHGFSAKRQVVYEIESPQILPDGLYFELQEKNISHVLFFSPHTTVIFATLLKKSGLENITAYLNALCLSADIAREAQKLAWTNIWISPQPTTESLIGYFHEKK